MDYLEFDSHESAEGVRSFEAMASVNEARWPALQAELTQVLAWCHAWGRAHGTPEPLALDDGGEWDVDLQVTREWSEPMATHYEPQRADLRLQPSGGTHSRWVATLVVSGHEAFATDFSVQFLGE